MFRDSSPPPQQPSQQRDTSQSPGLQHNRDIQALVAVNEEEKQAVRCRSIDIVRPNNWADIATREARTYIRVECMTAQLKQMQRQLDYCTHLVDHDIYDAINSLQQRVRALESKTS